MLFQAISKSLHTYQKIDPKRVMFVSKWRDDESVKGIVSIGKRAVKLHDGSVRLTL
jgi:hypothetical protein